MSINEIEGKIISLYSPQHIYSYDTYEQDLSFHFSKNLRYIRKKMGWNQVEIARLMAVSPSQYRKYESGEDIISSQNAAVFVQRSGIPYQYFFWNSGYHYLFRTDILDIRLIKLQAYACVCSNQQFICLFSFLKDITGKQSISDHAFCTKKAEQNMPTGEFYNYKVVGTNLKEFRHITKLTQEELSEALGVSTNTISNYESTKKASNFSSKIALRFWVAFGIAPIWLTYGSPFFAISQQYDSRLKLLSKLTIGLSDKELNDVMEIMHLYWKFKQYKQS